MSNFLTQKIQKLTPYVPGEQPKERKYIKLNTNESPFAPSKKAIELASESAKKLMLYPDPDCKILTETIANSVNVDAGQVIVTNGSDEVLNFAFMAYCDNDTPAIFPDITYGFYKVFAQVNGVPYKQIPLKDDFTIDVNDYKNANGTIFIANPNAPTGIALTTEQIEQILIANPNNIVVIDEAYVDFGGESCIPLVNKYDNLLVTQTFSKSRSMAGARLGFGVASKAIINDLMRIKYSTNPYNVNSMTASAGIGAILDKDYFTNNCKKIIENRAYTTEQLVKLGFELTSSSANFVFAKSNKISGENLYLALKEQGILVRHFNLPRINNYVRITIGNANEMETLINTIKKILEA